MHHGPCLQVSSRQGGRPCHPAAQREFMRTGSHPAQPTSICRTLPFLPRPLQDPRKRADANRVLQHEWMRENGTASERPLDNVILKRMRGFAAMNKLKKEALKVIAAGMTSEEIAGLRSMFHVSRPLGMPKASPWPGRCCLLQQARLLGAAVCVLAGRDSQVKVGHCRLGRLLPGCSGQLSVG